MQSQGHNSQRPTAGRDPLKLTPVTNDIVIRSQANPSGLDLCQFLLETLV